MNIFKSLYKYIKVNSTLLYITLCFELGHAHWTLDISKIHDISIFHVQLSWEKYIVLMETSTAVQRQTLLKRKYSDPRCNKTKL